jgi:hypothetical protein
MELFSCNNFSTAATMASLFNLYLSINWAGVPDSPKLSLTATNSCGAGLFKANLAPARPPRILCSSAVTIHFVL